MTDNTANEGLWLPNDIWATIASFLDHDDLARFRQLCSATQFVSSDIFIMQPLYNRLYAIDNTLPPLLPQEGTLAAFKQAFEKIQAKQQSEITYLTQHHPERMAESEQVFQKNTTVSLKSLETRHAELDKINSDIITAEINPNRAYLDLDGIGITRLPVTLFQEPAYAHFWQNLTSLYCNHNQLTTLDIQGLAALQRLDCNYNQLTTINMQGLTTLRWLYCNNNQLTTLNVQELVALQKLACHHNKLAALNVKGLAALQGLWCHKNQLTTLNAQGLTALQGLWCHNNQLTTLNVQGLAALQDLDCRNNPLKTLILTGLHANTKNKYAELERKLLFNKLRQTESLETRQAIIRRLGADYTYKNCFTYCSVHDAANSAYLFASSALSQTSAFLPSFSMANHAPENTDLKRKCNEDEMRIEGSSEDYDNQPDIKKRERQ